MKKAIALVITLLVISMTLAGCEIGERKNDTPTYDDIYRVDNVNNVINVIESNSDFSSICKEELIGQLTNVTENMYLCEGDGKVIYVYNDYGVSRLQLNNEGIISGIIEYKTVY